MQKVTAEDSYFFVDEAGDPVFYNARGEHVVARKIEKNFVKKFGSSESGFYFYLVEKLFENVLHRAEHNHVYYAIRGNKSATARFDSALESARATFEKKWKARVVNKTTLYPQSPKGEPCLRVVDYINWAIQRAYVRGETRYVDFLQEKLTYIVDILDHVKYPHNFYTSKNPFSVHKTSPLQLDP
jgi:hypothetical protein